MFLLPNGEPSTWELTPWTQALFVALDLIGVITADTRDPTKQTDKLVADRGHPDAEYHNGVWQYVYFHAASKFAIEDQIMRMFPEKLCIKDAEHLSMWYMCMRGVGPFGGPMEDRHDQR